MAKPLPAFLLSEKPTRTHDASLKVLEQLNVVGPLLSAARALSGLHVNDIARHAMLGSATIRRAESSTSRLTSSNLDRLVQAYADLGIVFVMGEDHRCGVVADATAWLAEPPKSKPKPISESLLATAATNKPRTKSSR